MLIENTNRWRQCTLKIDNPVEIFVRTPIQPIEQQAACRWEGDDDDDDHSYDDMIMVMVMTTITMMRWWWWLCLKFSWESGSDEPSNKPPAPLSHRQIELMSHYGRLQSHFQKWQIHLTLKIIVPLTARAQYNQPFSKCGKPYETPSIFSRSETTDITDIVFHFHFRF